MIDKKELSQKVFRFRNLGIFMKINLRCIGGEEEKNIILECSELIHLSLSIHNGSKDSVFGGWKAENSGVYLRF